jgi:hypothetical protein
MKAVFDFVRLCLPGMAVFFGIYSVHKLVVNREGVEAQPPRRGFTPAPRSDFRKDCYRKLYA